MTSRTQSGSPTGSSSWPGTRPVFPPSSRFRAGAASAPRPRSRPQGKRLQRSRPPAGPRPHKPPGVHLRIDFRSNQRLIVLVASTHRGKAMKRLIAALMGGLIGSAGAQDMTRYLDLTSPDMVAADTTRAEVEAQLAAAAPGHPADFTGKHLSGLDLSGLDLSHAVLRAARLNKTKLTAARLDGAVLDQAWLLEADLSKASLKQASLFAAQMQRAKLDGADLSGARIAADLSGASLVGASLKGADLGADMKNQSMGLMRAVLKSARLDRVDARDANLARADLEFASLEGADLSGASLVGAALAGANLKAATVAGADFSGADVDAMRLIAPVGTAKNLDKAENRARMLSK